MFGEALRLAWMHAQLDICWCSIKSTGSAKLYGFLPETPADIAQKCSGIGWEKIQTC